MSDKGVKYYKINREDEIYKKFQKINLKKYDICVYENQIYFVEKNDFKYRIKKFISKMKIELEKWIEKQNEINLLTG